MHISRIVLRRDAPENPAYWRFGPSEYDVHKRIWALFSDSPDRRRDFLYRQEVGAERPAFLSVSSRPPEDRTGLWDVQTKTYAPVLVTGLDLAFAVRANVVITHTDEAGRHTRTIRRRPRSGDHRRSRA